MVNDGDKSLLVQGGPNSGKALTLTGRPITFGRRPDNDVVVDETTVSRRYAIIMETPTGFVLRDLNSTNGTFVNRANIGIGEHQLKHGDRIRLAGADETFIFKNEGADTSKMQVGSPATGAYVLDPEPPAQQAAPPDLPSKEDMLLQFLESRRSEVCSREDIARAVWPEMAPGSQLNQEIDDTVDQVRNQIGDDVQKPVRLITVGEFGFLLI